MRIESMMLLGNTGPLRFVRYSGISLLLAMLLVVHNLAAQTSPAQDHASLGISLAREGKLSEAEHELREAVRAAPAVASYRAQLGSILGLQAKWKESVERFQKAVDLSPDIIN